MIDAEIASSLKIRAESARDFLHAAPEVQAPARHSAAADRVAKESDAGLIRPKSAAVSSFEKAGVQGVTPAAEARYNELFSKTDQDLIDQTWALKRPAAPPYKPTPRELEQFSQKFYEDASAGSRRRSASEKEFLIVMGLTGAGKSSSLVEPLQQKSGAMLIDADDVKKQLPGFDRGFGDDYVHRASSDISANVLKRALTNGDSVIYSTVGANQKKIDTLIGEARRRGYTNVGIHIADVPPDIASQRAFERTKRALYNSEAAPDDMNANFQMVHPMKALTDGYGPLEVYKRTTSAESTSPVDAYSRIDTNVGWNEKPNVLESKDVPSTSS